MQRFVRACSSACVAFVIAAFALGAVMQMSTGRLDLFWHNVPDVVLGASLFFAAGVLVVWVPVFSLLTYFSGMRLSRPSAVLLGASIGPLIFLAGMILLGETGHPPTLAGAIAYLQWALPLLVVPTSPFMVGGAVFGLCWSPKPQAAVPRSGSMLV